MAYVITETIAGSIGDDAIATATAQTFTFAKPGNVIVLSCEAGGLLRVSWNGTAPTTTITTEDANSRFVLCDGNEKMIRLPDSEQTLVVKIYTYSAFTNLGVSLLRG